MNSLTLTALGETKKYIIFIFLKNYIALLADWVESCVHQATKIPLTGFNKNLHYWNFLWTWKRLKTRSGLRAAWEAHSWVENRQTLESVTVDHRYVSPLVCPPHSEAYLHYFTLLRSPTDLHPSSASPPIPTSRPLMMVSPVIHSLHLPLGAPFRWCSPPLNRGPFVSHLKAELFSPIQAAQNEASSYFESHLNQSENTSNPPSPPLLLPTPWFHSSVWQLWACGYLAERGSVFGGKSVNQNARDLNTVS